MIGKLLINLSASAVPFIISAILFVNRQYGFGVIFLVVGLGLAAFAIIRSSSKEL